MKTSENLIQQQIFVWYNNNFCLKTHHPRGMIFSIPNGGTRNVREALTLKKTGLLPGASDLIVILPNGELIFVELKAEKGRQSDVQKDFQSRVENLGFKYKIFYSFFEFKEYVLYICSLKQSQYENL